MELKIICYGFADFRSVFHHQGTYAGQWVLDLLRKLVKITFTHISTKTKLRAISEEISNEEKLVNYKWTSPHNSWRSSSSQGVTFAEVVEAAVIGNYLKPLNYL